MTALVRDLCVEQGSDWPGEAFYIVDALGKPKTLTSSMTAWGAIGLPGYAPAFTWSSAGTDPAVGRIQFVDDTLIPIVTAAQSALWAFTNLPYQLYLTDPAGPPGDQTIRVARGTVYLDRQIGA